MLVGIRVDSSINIGTGHLMRCLNISNELKNRGASTIFIMRKHEGNHVNMIKNSGHILVTLPNKYTIVSKVCIA